MKIAKCSAVIATAGKVRNKSCRTGRTGRTGRTRPCLAKTQISGAILPRLFWIGGSTALRLPPTGKQEICFYAFLDLPHAVGVQDYSLWACP